MAGLTEIELWTVDPGEDWDVIAEAYMFGNERGETHPERGGRSRVKVKRQYSC